MIHYILFEQNIQDTVTNLGSVNYITHKWRGKFPEVHDKQPRCHR